MTPGSSDDLKPLIGVLVNKKFFYSPKGKLFAAKLYQANEITRCPVYFFAPEGIDWINRRIEGYVLDRHGRWQRNRALFPDVLYDRGVAFKNHENQIVEAVRRRFQARPGVKMINSCKLDKWSVHRKLLKHREAASFLPATRVYRGFADLQQMLEHYGFIFLKFSAGSGGREVAAIEKKTGGFYLHYYQRGNHQKRFFPGSRALRPVIAGIAARGAGWIVLQEGIDLAKYRGRIFDLRVLLVKDGTGNWVAVYNQARVAQKGALISNLALGGEVMDYSDIYSELKASHPFLPPDEAIRDAAITIARYIETELGPFGEIGMDMAVDLSGKIWFLEGNSKPSKLPEDKIEDTEGISPQFLMLLEYAMLLHTGAPVRTAINLSRQAANGSGPAD